MSPTRRLPELSRSFSRSIVADVHAPGVARRALQGLSGRVDEGLLERARLVVTELMSNSVRHARLAPGQKIELRVSTYPQRLFLEVIDDGDSFDPAASRPDPDRSPGGWGLRLVAELTDRWGIDFSHSTRVWCEFDA